MSEQVLNQFRCDKALREDCVAIYAALGMDLNTAFRMFMERSRMVGGLSFPAVLPLVCLCRIISVMSGFILLLTVLICFRKC